MQILYGLLFLFLLGSCNSGHHKDIPDISNLKINVEIIEVEKKLCATDSNSITALLKDLNDNHPFFTKIYTENVLQLTDTFQFNNPDLIQQCKGFVSDSAIRSLCDLISKQYADKADLKAQFNESAGFLKYYFPNIDIPRVYTLFSEFGVASFIFNEEKGKTALGVGLDFFLGQDIDYKKIDPQNPAFSQYLNRSFNRDHLVKKAWEVWIDDFIKPAENSRFVDQIIREGKKIMMLSSILPHLPDTILYEFSANQLKWCEQNAIGIWSFFLEKQFLYSSEQLKFNKYLKPSPNSPGMPEQAPGRTGIYIGHQIVKAYMLRKKMTKPSEILWITDAKQILEVSKFKPKNK